MVLAHEAMEAMFMASVTRATIERSNALDASIQKVAMGPTDPKSLRIAKIFLSSLLTRNRRT